MQRTLTWVAATALACVCPLAASAATTTVDVTLQDDSIAVSQPKIPAGAVHFVVKNDSIDDDHEMVVIADPKSQAELPFDKKKDRVPEAKLKSMGEVSDIKPGGSGMLDVKLSPGSYTLICNIKGHYRHGMHTQLTVQ